MKQWHWAFVFAGALTGVWLWNQMGHPTGHMGQPPRQPHPDDDISRLTSGGVPHCHPEQHHAGYVYTPHRYPHTTGGEITALIHKGYSPMRIPMGTPDAQWIIAPPSEVMI